MRAIEWDRLAKARPIPAIGLPDEPGPANQHAVAMERIVPSLILAASLALVFPGCDRGTVPASAPDAPEATTARVSPDHRFTIDVGGRPVRMRLAVLEHERNRGLMHVPSMPEDEGMLFVFPQPQRMSFYMRNTRIPLDIGYFAPDGTLQEVYPMYPYVEDAVLSSGDSIQFALEMNQGWFARQGVRPGAAIDLEAVRAALRQRGLAPGEHLGAR